MLADSSFVFRTTAHRLVFLGSKGWWKMKMFPQLKEKLVVLVCGFSGHREVQR